MTDDTELDRPIWGGLAIGRAVGLVDESGNVKLAKTLYALERGYIPATHMQRQWITTLRRIGGEPA